LRIAVQLTVLGSGSAGNATLLASGERRVLVDLGLSVRETARRLESRGIVPESGEAIVVTHAHGDHTQGAAAWSRRYGVPIYAAPATWIEWAAPDVAEWRPLAPGRSTDVCGFGFVPFEVPHDASQTLAFRIETTDGAIGFATDIGAIPRELEKRFRDCRVVVIESNHAIDLLRVSPYAASTRARIGSDRGHLSNEALARFVRDGLGATVRCLVLMHLSRVNNLPELAEMTCREALIAGGRLDVAVVVTRQECVAETVDLGRWIAPPPWRPAAQARLPFN
jgi:phosphoribosyl 1,2-cyclic phosphodiesterase